MFPRIDAKNIDREVQPNRSSFSGKMEVAKPFLCSKLSICYIEVAKLLAGRNSDLI